MMKYSVCIDAVFEGMPVPEALAAVKAAGFDAFEFWSWWDKDLDELRRARDKEGLDVVACCTKFISLVDAGRRTDYLEGLRESVEAARSLDCGVLIATVGDELAGVPRSEQRASLVDGLKEAAPIVEDAGLTLAFEPLNILVDHAGYYLVCADEAFGIEEEVGSPRVKVLYDIYHQQISEGFLTRRIVDNIGKIAHFHAAGVPGRKELFRGEIDYAFLMNELDRLGYQGAVGLEYWPVGDGVASLRETLRYLGKS